MKMTRQEKQLSFQNQRRKKYFEGWYFKQVSGDESVVFSVIPSMMRSKTAEKAMLQMILAENRDGQWRIQTAGLDFPMGEFHHTKDPFSLKIGSNAFSREGISLDIASSDDASTAVPEISCDISFGPFTMLPTSVLAPTIMGPFSYLPFMECIHGIGSLHHTLRGSLQIDDRRVSFDGGVGYIEKDWGHSFPKSYVWLQSNHFRHRPSCLFFSWADIPLGPFQFPGFICHLWIEGKHHRFATYNRARCTIDEMNEEEISVTLRKGHRSLWIRAKADIKGVLSAPKHGQMDHQIKEGLAGTIDFRFTDELAGEVIEDSSSLAGVEIMPRLLTKE